MADSNSTGEMLIPPEMMRSFSLSTKLIRPASSQVPRSPLCNHPSWMAAAVSSGASQYPGVTPGAADHQFAQFTRSQQRTVGAHHPHLGEDGSHSAGARMLECLVGQRRRGHPRQTPSFRRSGAAEPPLAAQRPNSSTGTAAPPMIAVCNEPRSASANSGAFDSARRSVEHRRGHAHGAVR